MSPDTRRQFVAFLTAVLAHVLAPAAWGQSPRFAALFTDGTYLREGRLTDGHDPAAQPKIEGRLLDDPQKPARWVRNLSLAPGTAPRAFVEFAGGDRIAGEVVGYRSGEEKPYDREFPYLLLSLGEPSRGEPARGEPPGSPRRAPAEPGQIGTGEITVAARWLRRIVWQPAGGDRYQPGTLIYRDGRRGSLRRVRFNADRVLALLEDGPKEIAMAELAELHFPQIDPWDAYFEQLTVIAADDKTRLVTLQTDDGQRMTTTTSRLTPRHHGNANDPNNWDFLIQPAWSPKPFWISHARVHTRTYFSPHEVPLAGIEPLKIDQRSTSGTRFLPGVDRNVRGEFLQTGARGFAWGLGTQASCAITFPLPAAARGFRSFVGLDQLAGDGGCAVARVFAGTTDGKPLYESKPLIGSSEIADTGRIDLAGLSGGEKKLTLVSDAAHRGRPAGADPLDIRDFVDWLEPVLELDPAKLKSEIASRAFAAVPAWVGWSVRGGSGGPEFSSRWDDSDPRNRRHVVEIVAPGTGAPALTLSSRQRIAADHDYLLIAARQSKGGQPARIGVRIAGEAAGEFEVSGRDDKSTSRPILVPVANFRGRDVDIELTLTGGGESNRIRFGALTLVGEPNKNQWTTLRPQRVTSADGTVLVIQPDGSILASGPRPPQDRFTVEGQTNVSGITAIRLEALADPALEKLGPGRGPNGSFLLTDFRVTAAPVGNTDEPRPVPLANASSDFSPPNQPAANAIDNNAASGWGIAGATGQSHVAVFETRKEIENAAGTILTIQLHHGYGQSQMLGRFRVSVTTDPRPVRIVEGGVIHAAAPSARGGLKVVFDDERQFIESLTEGRPNTRVETKDKYSRGLCLRVKPGDAGGAKLAGVSLPIRAQPAAGEYRYMRFAWRKQGGARIALALAVDGKWDATPAGGGASRKLIYFAGPKDNSLANDAITVHDPTPVDWVVVTRDLFVDFGPITITGLKFHCPDGQNALFDQIQVAQSMEQFEAPGR